MTSTYKTGETPAVGDVVRVGNGDVLWAVKSVYELGGVSLRRSGPRPHGGAWSKWIEGTKVSTLVLITPASDAERAAAERRMAEVEAEGVRLRELARARRRVEQFVEQYIDTPSYGDKILSLGRMVDGQATDFALTISDLQALLTGGNR